jgi:hypothetical protein
MITELTNFSQEGVQLTLGLWKENNVMKNFLVVFDEKHHYN